MTVQRLVGDKSSPMSVMADQHLRAKGLKDGDLICQWFAGNELKSDAFVVGTIEAVNPSS